jgi:hypothetical protein
VAVTAAPGATSAEVAFPAINATDAVTGSPRVECVGKFAASPLAYAAGAKATFPLGATDVSCTAKDDAGNLSPAGNFTVTVCEDGFTFANGACAGARLGGRFVGRGLGVFPGGRCAGALAHTAVLPFLILHPSLSTCRRHQALCYH